MNAFSKVLARDEDTANRLGCPLWGPDNMRRAQRMYEMTRGNGFRVYPTEPRVYPDGKTRGQRKRERRAAAAEKEVDRQRTEANLMITLSRGHMSKAEAYSRFGSL